MSFIHHFLRPQQGYTIIESVVGLALMAMLATLIFFALVQTLGYFTTWQTGIALENKAQLIASRISLDVRYASRVVPSDINTWTVYQRDGKQIAYAIEDSTLFRNGLPMHNADIYTTRIQLELPQSDDITDRLLLEGSHIHVALATLKDSIVIDTFISPRKTYTWSQNQLD